MKIFEFDEHRFFASHAELSAPENLPPGEWELSWRVMREMARPGNLAGQKGVGCSLPSQRDLKSLASSLNDQLSSRTLRNLGPGVSLLQAISGYIKVSYYCGFSPHVYNIRWSTPKNLMYYMDASR